MVRDWLQRSWMELVQQPAAGHSQIELAREAQPVAGHSLTGSAQLARPAVAGRSWTGLGRGLVAVDRIPTELARPPQLGLSTPG